MKVVFDTNIFISAFLMPGGQAEHALVLARHKTLRSVHFGCYLDGDCAKVQG
jgi:predicted nucleic acid-binding protein